MWVLFLFITSITNIYAYIFLSFICVSDFTLNMKIELANWSIWNDDGQNKS